MSRYHRRLPHEHPAGRALFLTWHLNGSLPHARYPPPGKMNSGSAFVLMDRYLDTTRTGPLCLRQPPIARAVVETIHYAAETLDYFELHAYVVMPNHVRLLLTPHVEPRKLLKSVKNFSARRANEILSRKGKPFWQSESYDRWVRGADEFDRTEPCQSRIGSPDRRLSVVERGIGRSGGARLPAGSVGLRADVGSCAQSVHPPKD